VLSLCQYLQLQPWPDVNLLFEKHGLITGQIDEAEMRADRQAAFNTIETSVRGAPPEQVMSMLGEIARTQGNFRNRVTPRYVYDERWSDLTACLMLDGYRADGGRLTETEPALEAAAPVEDDLTEELRRSDLANSADIVRMMNSSAEDFRRAEPDFNGCLNNARVALQALATAISRTRADRPPGLDETKWGQVLAHLRTTGFITNEEERGLAGVFAFVSPGSHTPVGLSERETARLGRSLCATMCYFLVKRYNG
jgi:hypothetical protein